MDNIEQCSSTANRIYNIGSPGPTQWKTYTIKLYAEASEQASVDSFIFGKGHESSNSSNTLLKMVVQSSQAVL